MELLPILKRYQASFYEKYADRITPEQSKALNAMLDCRTARFGEMHLQCSSCDYQQSAFHSCGHRSCPRCQHYDTSRWLDRQSQKLLPVNYFMATFTIPYELRALARHDPKTVYDLLFHCAIGTLKDFGVNSPKLGADMGMTAVLHTHSRRLDYHPHVHIVKPGGCLNKKRKQWKKLRGKYLFNEFALATVFRARFLEALKQAGFSLPANVPEKWVVNCKFVGKGLPALTYLARYLYRGVISEKNILCDNGTDVTFRYKESKSGDYKSRVLKGEDFIWLLLQHVLPKGFRRARDFGFLHGNAKQFLKMIQLALGIIAAPVALAPRPIFKCARCSQPMSVFHFAPPAWRFG